MSPRPGYTSVTLLKARTERLDDWRATQRPIPSTSQTLDYAIEMWLRASEKQRQEIVHLLAREDEK